MAFSPPRFGKILVVALAGLLFLPLPATSQDSTKVTERKGPSIWTDLKWLGNSMVEDGISILSAPLTIKDMGIREKNNLLMASLGLVSLGALIPADEPIRKEIRTIPDNEARLLTYLGTGLTAGSIGLIYGVGWITSNNKWRTSALLGAESAAFSFGLARLSKLAFGRKRPDSKRSSLAWFSGGESFVSDTAAVAFALATTLGDTFENPWWALIPGFAAATAVGIGRMGEDRHWLTDIGGSALLGFGTSRFISSLHSDGRQALRLSIFPFSSPRYQGLGFRILF